MQVGHQRTGPQLRDSGIAAALDADHAVHRDYRDQVEVVLAHLIDEAGPFDADDVRRCLPDDVAARMAPGLLGAVLREASRAGHVRQVGWRTSSRPSRHSGALRVWRATSTPGLDWTAAA